ncbi:MAG: hypothetical protein M0Q88_02435 [Bacilli bacterium]|nr:hypothetical protein [Bacilli bacterium]
MPWKGRTLFDKSNVFESLEFSNISFFDAKFNYTGFYSREYKQKFAVLNSTNIKEIRTKEDLVNLEDGYYYKLMNDLDLKGVVWNPLVFNGTFDGGGNTIKNLDVLFSDDKAEVTIGMFKEFNGILKNLNIRKIPLQAVKA